MLFKYNSLEIVPGDLSIHLSGPPPIQVNSGEDEDKLEILWNKTRAPEWLKDVVSANNKQGVKVKLSKASDKDWDYLKMKHSKANISN